MSNEEIRENIKHNQELMKELKRRKHYREMQLAQQGINVDPSITMEIEDINNWIFKLQQETERLALNLPENKPEGSSHEDLIAKMNTQKDTTKRLEVISGDRAIKNRIWNEIMPPLNGGAFTSYETLWTEYFKLPADQMPRPTRTITNIQIRQEMSKMIRSYFFSCNMAEFYRFILFILRGKKGSPTTTSMIIKINKILEQEGSKYRYKDIDHEDKENKETNTIELIYLK